MPWFYSAGGEQKGPVEAAEFESLIATGAIRPETLVWQPGMPNWQPASEARPDLLPPVLPGVPGVPAPLYPSESLGLVGGRRYGGFWIRLVARIIDGLVLAIPSIIIIGLCMVLFLGMEFISSGLQDLDRISPFAIMGAVLAAMLANFCIQALYECYMVTNYSATLGKMAMGLKIVTLEGGRLDFRQCLIRVALYQGVSLLGLIPLVGLLVTLYFLADIIVLGTDARKQSLHDRFAKTLVVYK